jgi:holo-[acyl-carrier protein] synthase
MGTGFAHGMWIRDVGIVQDRRGKPEVIYSARGERLRRKLGIGAGHVTLTDEAGLVVAVAVLMTAPPAPAKSARRTAVRRGTRRAPRSKARP